MTMAANDTRSTDMGLPERSGENAAGRSRDAGEAHAGSAIIDVEGEQVGTVVAAEGKYIEVDGSDGDHYWLSVSTIKHVTDGTVQLNFGKAAVEGLALTDSEQLEAGLEAPVPATDASLDAIGSEQEEVARRKNLVEDS
jgi:hypothetical protein